MARSRLFTLSCFAAVVGLTSIIGCSSPGGGGGGGGADRCTGDAMCNDGDACTADACVNGTCVNVPIEGCGGGEGEGEGEREGDLQPDEALDRLLQASEGDGDLEEALDMYADAIRDSYLDDPEGASRRLREAISSVLDSPERVEQYVDLQHNLAGRTTWTPSSLHHEKTRSAQTIRPDTELDRVVAVYVNGINTTFDGAELDKVMLADLLASISELTGVGLHYNLSATDDERSFWGGLICPAAHFFFDLDPDMCTSWGGWLVDFVEATADKMVDFIGDPDLGIDHREIADRVSQDLQGGLGVLLVGHSQGNFKIERALDLLWDNYNSWASDVDAARDILGRRIGVLAIGCPADYSGAISRGIAVKKFNIRRSASLLENNWDLSGYAWLQIRDLHIDEDIVSLLDTTQPEGGDPGWLENKWDNLYMAEIHSRP